MQVLPKEKYRKDKQLKKPFAMPTSQSWPAHESEDEELIDELVPGDDREAGNQKTSLQRQPVPSISSRTFPRTHIYCRTCQRARMMAPHARRKGGQKRVETQVFGDHIIGDHVIIKKNVEEGLRGEQVALVLKDLHTQYRFVYPSQSKDAQSSVDALNHFIGAKDDVQVVYTDISPELIRAIKNLDYRHQTSIEYVDSSKSFAEREVRQMLEGARSNLLQPGLPLKMWQLAMQHHATRAPNLTAVNPHGNPGLVKGSLQCTSRLVQRCCSGTIPKGQITQQVSFPQPQMKDFSYRVLHPTRS